MVSSKRRPKEDATYPHTVGHAKDELDAMMRELELHVALRIAEAQRLNLPKVRFEMIDMSLAETLLELIRCSRRAVEDYRGAKARS